MKKNLYSTWFSILIFVFFQTSHAEIPFAGITITVDKITDACAGSNTGAINISVTGNKGECSYNWTGSNGYSKKSKNINNLAAGTYYLIVKDTKGNTASLQVEVASLTAIAVNSTVADIECFISTTGAIDLTVSGGSGSGYIYNWTGPNGFKASTEDLSNLTAGTYNVIVKDLGGCETATSVTVSDDFVDVYENNNLLSNAKTIPLYFPIIARIAPSASDIDWYKFTTEPASATYSLRVVSETLVFIFEIYDASGNMIPGIVIDTKSKVYHSLSANTTYYIKVSGTVSNSCYNLQIAPPIVEPLITSKGNTLFESPNQTAKIFPNPHNGSFTLNIESPLDGIATIEIYNANGQKLNTQKQAAIKGKNILASYQNMKGNILFYRILIGNKQLTGKIIGTN